MAGKKKVIKEAPVLETNPRPEIYIPSDIGRYLTKLNKLLGELALVWKPHELQMQVLEGLFIDRHPLTVIEAGRQIGKSELLIVAYGLWGQLVPSSASFYLAPALNQARMIVWDSGRIEGLVPGNWIDSFKEKNNTVYWSGSKHCFLRVDGTDNFDAKRGVTIRNGLLGLDECRDMKAEVWETLKPALGVGCSSTIMTSTPPKSIYPYKEDPKRPHWFLEVADEVRAGHQKGKWFHARTVDNPYFPPDKIDEERERLYRQERGYVFEREYLGMRVEDQSGKRWPMLVDKEKYVKPHAEVMAELMKDASKLRYYCMTDPAGASVWAWLFVAINPYTRHIYVLDEIYETDKRYMATGVIWPKARAKILELYGEEGKWRKYYDEAETWFANEMWQNHRVSFDKTTKVSRSKEENLVLLSDIFLENKITFSDRCEFTYWEFLNYEDDKSPDHNIDNTRYLLSADNYSLPKKAEPEGKISKEEERFRKVTMPQRQKSPDLWNNVLRVH